MQSEIFLTKVKETLVNVNLILLVDEMAITSLNVDEIKAANEIFKFCLSAECFASEKLFPTGSHDSYAVCGANILRNLTCNNTYFKDEVMNNEVSMTGILAKTFNLLAAKHDSKITAQRQASLSSADLRKLGDVEIKDAANFYELGEALLSTLKNLTSKSLRAKTG